jgi:hypothetical protein
MLVNAKQLVNIVLDFELAHVVFLFNRKLTFRNYTGIISFSANRIQDQLYSTK